MKTFITIVVILFFILVVFGLSVQQKKLEECAAKGGVRA